MSYQYKITLISCYFGRFPWYFPLFVKSCEYNRSIEFLIFSDSIYESSTPSNLKIIPFNLEKFNHIASNKLQLKVEVYNPYKLCDFKPAYGVIFSEFLKNADFWGCCDIDLVFGRIRKFLTDKELKKLDFFSARKEYPSGFFMLFRNNKRVNHLFSKSKDYKTIFESSVHYCFDECNFVHDRLTEGQNLLDIKTDIESLHHIILKESRSGNISSSFRLCAIEGLPAHLKWSKGLLIFREEFEVLLFHLINYKSNIFTSSYIKKPVPDAYHIDRYYFSFLSKSNPAKFLYSFYYKFFRPTFKILLHKIDFLISKIYLKNQKIYLVIGTYRYWNTFAKIDNSISRNYTISFVGDPVRYQLYSSTLKKETIYVSGKKNVIIRVPKDQTNPNFNWIDKFGNLKKYVFHCYCLGFYYTNCFTL